MKTALSALAFALVAQSSIAAPVNPVADGIYQGTGAWEDNQGNKGTSRYIYVSVDGKAFQDAKLSNGLRFTGLFAFQNTNDYSFQLLSGTTVIGGGTCSAAQCTAQGFASATEQFQEIVLPLPGRRLLKVGQGTNSSTGSITQYRVQLKRVGGPLEARKALEEATRQ